jgi:GT2 family glycosyltransferase
MGKAVAVIIVTHNSISCLEQCLQSLAVQTEIPVEVVVVDSGSEDTSYLHHLTEKYFFELILKNNIGFSCANNEGVSALSANVDYILFINPDIFLPPSFIQSALTIIEENLQVGIVSGKLLGYNLKKRKANGRIDSTGVQRKVYGRWFDRGKGEKDLGQYDSPEEMAALCGALLFCRKSALRSLQAPVFDPDFFLYKEDIELCLRLRKKGWKLLYNPELTAYHCRGWQGERTRMSYFLRKTATKSELLLYRKHPSPYMVWAIFKYFLVTVFRM